MATMVLGTVGGLVGGPLGAAVGAFAGRIIDGGGSRGEGPRLRDLAVTTSTYGQAIARHFGQVRVPGTIIWASDLAEHGQRSGGKGRPRATTYSYSISLAIALSSRPIDRLGRIWADGNLLREAEGAMLGGATLRLYRGHPDQPVDPLLANPDHTATPAYRNLAYVILEDLELAEFGNRVPALSFEVFAGPGARTIAGLLEPERETGKSHVSIGPLDGYSYEDGPLGRTISTIDQLWPLHARIADGQLAIADSMGDEQPRMLPETMAWGEGELAQRDGRAAQRFGTSATSIRSVRYYDIARDYQPGMQRTEGPPGTQNGRQIEFPGTLTAANARKLATAAGERQARCVDTIVWRIGEIDPTLMPGSLVRLPGEAGLWIIRTWEWREGGIELELQRHVPREGQSIGAAAGTAWTAPLPDLATTTLRVFELPPEQPAAAYTPRLFAAVGGTGGRWTGASLFYEADGQLVAVPSEVVGPAANGELAADLFPASPLLLDRATMEVTFERPEITLTGVTMQRLANGANKILVGGEIVQFLDAVQTGAASWRLSGLLRGRGGTEHHAGLVHPAGTLVTMLDESLMQLDAPSLPLTPDIRFAAIGPMDDIPRYATLQSYLASRKPLSPVHCEANARDGLLELRWCRRTRGAWQWFDGADLPLMEQRERYEVGIGIITSPRRSWFTDQPSLTLSADDLDISAAEPLWVRQIGDVAPSDATLFAKPNV